MNPTPLIYIAAGSLVLLYVFKRAGYFDLLSYRRGLTSSLIDFLLTLQVFEANGMRLPRLMEASVEGRVSLPPPYVRLSKTYRALCRVIHEPYTCIRRLSTLVPEKRVSEFLSGYSEIAVSTGDTLHYVESAVSREMERITGAVNSMLSMVDSMFEGLLILILSIIVYDYLPLGGVNPALIALVLASTGIAGYTVIRAATGRLMWPRTMVEAAASLIAITIGGLLPILYPSITPFLLLLFLALTVPVATYHGRLLALESSLVNLLEEIYVGVRQGLPVEHILLSTGNKGFPALARRLLGLGYNYSDIVRSVCLPPLSRRTLSLVLAPLTIGSVGERHVGVVLRFTGIIRGLRERLGERGRIYYGYALTLPAVLIAFARSLAGMDGGAGFPVVGVGVAAVIVSFIVAGIATGGCGVCKYKNIVLAFLTYIAMLILSP